MKTTPESRNPLSPTVRKFEGLLEHVSRVHEKLTCMQKAKFDLSNFPVHLALGAQVVEQARFTGDMDWYAAYGARHGGDGAEGRLVSVHTFGVPWDSWEMHPKGEELVVCLDGEITLHQELSTGTATVTLNRYEAMINPRGVWHRADVRAEATALFITAGEGTEHRRRDEGPV